MRKIFTNIQSLKSKIKVLVIFVLVTGCKEIQKYQVIVDFKDNQIEITGRVKKVNNLVVDITMPSQETVTYFLPNPKVKKVYSFSELVNLKGKVYKVPRQRLENTFVTFYVSITGESNEIAAYQSTFDLEFANNKRIILKEVIE